jgi:HK97 gp10 family phage protein
VNINTVVKIADFTQQIIAQKRQQTLAGLEASKGIVHSAMNTYTPYKRGKLRRSNDVTVDREESALRMGTGGKGARHANLIIFGTRHHPPQDYMTKAANKTKGTVRENIKRGHRQ